MASPRKEYVADATGRYILYHAPALDPAWALEDAIKKRPLPVPSERAQKQKNGLRASISKFLAGSRDPEYNAVFQRGTSICWEAVRSEAEEALQKYANQGQSWKNPFRRAARIVGGVATRLEFLLQLVPNGDYLGVLCGGLTLVYNAAKRQEELRGMIMESLHGLDAEIDQTKSYIREYSWNPRLRETTEELYIAILNAIEQILDWITKRRGVLRGIYEFGKSMVQQEEYGHKVQDSIQSNIQTRVREFERAIRQCLSTEVHAMSQNVYHLGEDMGVVDGKVDVIGGNITKTVSGVKRLEDMLRDIAKDVQHLKDNQKAQPELQHPPPVIDRLTPSHHQLSLITTPAVQQPTYPTIPTATVEQLLAALNANWLDPSRDTIDQIVSRQQREHDIVLYRGARLDTRLQDRIALLLHNPKFTTWFQRADSQVLVINGMGNMLLLDVVSPLSYLCAMLARTVAAMPHSYPLSFYCRLHCEQVDPLCGVSGMLRSFITQLILQTDTQNVSFLTWVDLDKIWTGEPAVVWDLFVELLQRQHPAAIVCIIDGVSFLDKEPYQAGLGYIMNSLNELVRFIAASQNNLVFKLLVTNPTVNENFKTWFAQSTELNMPFDASQDGPVLGGLPSPLGFNGVHASMMGLPRCQ